jgi:HSP20 family protein
MLPIIRKRAMWPDFTNDFFKDDIFYPVFKRHNYYSNTPAVNIIEDEEQFKIELAAPGLDKKDLHINLKDDLLTISAESKEVRNEESEGKVTRQEFSYNSFCRSFSIPDSVDTEKIKAVHKNGILTVHIPKMEESKNTLSREIKIG